MLQPRPAVRAHDNEIDPFPSLRFRSRLGRRPASKGVSRRPRLGAPPTRLKRSNLRARTGIARIGDRKTTRSSSGFGCESVPATWRNAAAIVAGGHNEVEHCGSCEQGRGGAMAHRRIGLSGSRAYITAIAPRAPPSTARPGAARGIGPPGAVCVLEPVDPGIVRELSDAHRNGRPSSSGVLLAPARKRFPGGSLSRCGTVTHFPAM